MEQIEVYWRTISYSNIIVKMLIMGYVLYCFAKPFMENKKGAVLSGVTYFVTILLLYLMPFKIGNFAAYGTGIFAAWIVMCKTDRRNYQQKFFIAATFFSVRWLSTYMTGIITEIMYQQMIDTKYMAARPIMQFIAYIGVEITDVALVFVITGVSVRCIVKSYVYKSENMNIKEMCMLIVPSVTGMTGYGIVQYYQDYMEINAAEGILGTYKVLAFLHYGISIITIVVVTILFQSVKARQEEKMQNELLAVQIENTQKHIEQVENLYQNIRSIKHDMTNHIITLERLYAGNKTEEARAYSEELRAALSEAAGRINSGNPVTDVILQEMQREAEKRQIRFKIDFHYPTDSNVNAFDISVILNNALQNALEYASKEEKSFISVISYRRNNAYMIEISNSFKGGLKWDKESGLPVTSKGKTEESRFEKVHGYGLANIRRVAKKYSGDIAVDLNNEIFCLSILLMTEI